MYFEPFAMKSKQGSDLLQLQEYCRYEYEDELKYLRHRGPVSVASSVPSPQLSQPVQTKNMEIHLPLPHVN